MQQTLILQQLRKVSNHLVHRAHLLTSDRLLRFQNVLSLRNGGIWFVLENVYNEFNAAAIFRNLDAFGIQNVVIIRPPEREEDKGKLVKFHPGWPDSRRPGRLHPNLPLSGDDFDSSPSSLETSLTSHSPSFDISSSSPLSSSDSPTSSFDYCPSSSSSSSSFPSSSLDSALSSLAGSIGNRCSRRGLTVSRGASQWLSTTFFTSSEDAVSHLRSRNCQIWASDLQSTRSLPISQILSSYTSTPSSSHSHSSSRPPSLSPSSSPAPSRRNLAIVLGNEELGISEVMRRESDQLFYVPMKGMTKSYNVSSFSAVLLSTLEAHKEQLGDYLQPLGELEKEALLLRWILLYSSPTLRTICSEFKSAERLLNHQFQLKIEPELLRVVLG